MLETATAASAGDRAALKAQLGFSPQTRLIGAIGRLSVEKGQRYLVEAAAELARDFHDLKIVLLGEGRERTALEAQIKQLGLDGVVLLPGFQKNIALWMQALDVLANCSLTEGLPNVILEALAAGTPVVATAVGGVPELIRDRETGLLVPAANPAELARALATILRDLQLAGTLRRSGRAWVQTRFSPARQRESLLAIYRQCLGLRPVSSAPREQNEIQERAEISAPLQAESLPSISVVLPVRNEEAHLGAVLDGLLAQEYPQDRYEILVVDGNSTDGTARVVEEAAKVSAERIRLLPNPRQLSAAGRNVGVRNSAGELIVFIDGHCWIPNRELLLNSARLFETTGAACLCRPQPLTAPGNTWFQKVVADVRATVIGHGLNSAIYSTELEDYVNPTSSGASYRRSVFDHVGFYDERFDACEDVEFNYRVFRAGLRSYTSPRLTVQYATRKTFSGLWKQMVRYGKGRYRFAGIHPEAFSFAQALPAAFLLWLALGGAGALVSRRFATLFLATLAVYAGIVAASSVWLGIRQGWRHLVTAPAVYLTIHLGLGAGFLTGAVWSIRQRFSSQRAAQEVPRASAEEASFPRVRILSESEQDAPSSSRGTHRSKTTPVNAFSVDVEDYFHTEAMSGVVSREAWEHMPSRVQSNTYRLFELLAKHDVRGTFFFLGWVAERFPGLVREAVQLGHEVGCHSYWHRPVYRLSPAEFRADTRQALKAIEDAGGVGVRGYRAPSFSMVPGTEWAAEILGELGFRYDSSVHPIRHDLYSNASAPRIPHRVHGGAILELPIATTRVAGNNLPVGGGGYFRILPYAYTRWGLSRLNGRESQSGVVYLHPWEIDPEQPRLAAGFQVPLPPVHGPCRCRAEARSPVAAIFLRAHFHGVPAGIVRGGRA